MARPNRKRVKGRHRRPNMVERVGLMLDKHYDGLPVPGSIR